MRKKWKILIGAAVVIILIGTLGRKCVKVGSTIPAGSEESQTHTVARGQILSQIEITGEVQPQTLVSIKSKVSGKIVKFYLFQKQGWLIETVQKPSPFYAALPEHLENKWSKCFHFTFS
ncbi:MAG: hypothetical protein Q8M98_01725 [Candidatus Cloacimonadaceae bacterium]|nr:hypothetical protein [Candidatus Cloacimonadaceae bacterium]